MASYSIQWTPAALTQLSTERYAHFFAIEQHGQLVFAGKAYQENLEALIPACIDHLDLDSMEPKVYLGRIREVGLGQINHPTVDAILGMLVFAKKPRYNRVGKYRFLGTLDLELANVGLELLPAKLRVENNVVIVGAHAANTLHSPILAC